MVRLRERDTRSKLRERLVHTSGIGEHADDFLERRDLQSGGTRVARDARHRASALLTITSRERAECRKVPITNKGTAVSGDIHFGDCSSAPHTRVTAP